MEKGTYYLHLNGDLIFEPFIVYSNIPHFFTSFFIISTWKVLDNFKRADWKILLTDAFIKGALPFEVRRVGIENGLDESDIKKIWETPR